MPLHMLKIAEVAPFTYAFDGNIKARMADIGRKIGSKAIGFAIQTVPPGCQSSRRHKHVFQEEILIIMSGSGLLHHAAERIAVGPSDCVCYLPEDPEPHTFENTGSSDLVIWAFGNRCPHEICLYPDQGLAFVEGLGADAPLDQMMPSDWTEERRPR
jgi:uncharacterized cupin superfamily protein